MNTYDTVAISRLATQIRRDVVEMLGGDGHVGHLGGSCSSADIVAVLFQHRMRHDPQNPKWEGRDKLVFSKGHACIAQYAALCEYGYFDRAELPKLKSFGAMLQGHPDRNKTPGIEVNTGSLGQGLSICNGMALAAKLDKKDTRVYCIIGDGELAEGSVWEGAMSGAHFKLDNLCAIVDRNRLQISGNTEDVMAHDSQQERWAAFGWNVVTVNGHDYAALADAFRQARECKGKPTVIIAETVKGYGSPVMENKAGWHHHVPTAEEYETIIADFAARKEAALHE